MCRQGGFDEAAGGGDKSSAIVYGTARSSLSRSSAGLSRRHAVSSPSPRLRGEGRDEGALTTVWTRGESPHPDPLPVRTLGDAHVLVRQNDSGRSLGIPFALSRMMMCPTLWSSRSVAMSLRSLSLGRFGDRRLDKRGRRCSDAWWCVRASACGDWRGGGGRNRLVLDGFWQIPR